MTANTLLGFRTPPDTTAPKQILESFAMDAEPVSIGEREAGIDKAQELLAKNKMVALVTSRPTWPQEFG